MVTHFNELKIFKKITYIMSKESRKMTCKFKNMLPKNVTCQGDSTNNFKMYF
jgi:hypothetical protein